MRFASLIPLVLLLAACAGTPQEDEAGLIPVYTGPVDPSDAVMRAAVEDFLRATGAPAASDYNFTRHDLDDDGRREALVLFKSPYGYWCDMNGCTMLVLKAQDESFTLVNAIQPVREPLYVSSAQSNGWKDLVVHVSGRWEPTKDVAMAFNGQQYPANPEDLPPAPAEATREIVRVFQR